MLDIRWNQLTALPLETEQLVNLIGLHIEGNPVAPPANIVAQGKQAILNYINSWHRQKYGNI